MSFYLTKHLNKTAFHAKKYKTPSKVTSSRDSNNSSRTFCTQQWSIA